MHVGGTNNWNAAIGNPDFKMTMKHNSSNQSIQSTKKMIQTIRKPTELFSGGLRGPSALVSEKGALGVKKNNNNNNGMQMQQSSNSNYTSPYNQKNAAGPIGKNIH